MSPTEPIPVAAGDLHWFDGFLLKVLLPAADTGGQLSVCEQRHPAGYGTPVHVHHREDQTLHVVDGQITAWLDPHGDAAERTVVTGESIFLPRDVPHAFRVETEGTRVLEINTPGGFEGFHIEAGEPAPEDRIPDPSPPDIDTLVEVAARYDCEVTGPPVGRG
ncbi:MAG: cupin domain-containing protein [Acidimicrobiia bacterium]|nr:cupin domain-containing protein [Acidimicrobiia bacterium]